LQSNCGCPESPVLHIPVCHRNAVETPGEAGEYLTGHLFALVELFLWETISHR